MAKTSTAKLKLAGKSPRKTAAKPKAKTGAKKTTAAKIAAKSATKTAKKPGKVIPLRAKQEAKKPKESIFARLLREKKERQQQHQQAQSGQQHQHQATYQPMPANHAKFSKFAGPRRRAS